MQKTTDVLLMLTSEERENAQGFIRRRLKTLDTEQLAELQALTQMSKQFVRRWQLEKGQYTRASSRAAKLMVKLHDAALADIQGLIKELNLVINELNNKVQKQLKESGNETNEEQDIAEIVITCEEEEIQYAAEYIQGKIGDLRASDLKVFRDSCQEVPPGGKVNVGRSKVCILTNSATSTPPVGDWPFVNAETNSKLRSLTH